MMSSATDREWPGELAEIAGKEALMLPIEAGRLEKVLTVEVRADSHLHPFDEIHQDKARGDELSIRLEYRLHIGAGTMTTDEGWCIRTVGF